MLKIRPQGTVGSDNREFRATNLESKLASHKATKGWFRLAFRIPKRQRQGVSKQALDVAKRMMKEYQADLDYLKDR
ncbi:MAG: hypothetical protein E6J34_17610 [Chloroflexi bacterium]|nr:MAG: hypothetical protein E6J34_17610 [Chloroflexota bacterium]